jgi:hypothetical protein
MALTEQTNGEGKNRKEGDDDKQVFHSGTGVCLLTITWQMLELFFK